MVLEFLTKIGNHKEQKIKLSFSYFYFVLTKKVDQLFLKKFLWDFDSPQSYNKKSSE